MQTRDHLFWIEVVQFLIYTPLAIFALHNFVRYIIKQKRYREQAMLAYYILLLSSTFLRLIESVLLCFDFYCNLKVVDIAQAATICKLGLGITHTSILAQLNFKLLQLEHDIYMPASKTQESSI